MNTSKNVKTRGLPDLEFWLHNGADPAVLPLIYVELVEKVYGYLIRGLFTNSLFDTFRMSIKTL